MTIVTVNEKWRILVDDWNYTLEYLVKGGVLIDWGLHKGKLSSDKWHEYGFYPNLSQCIRAIVRADSATLPDSNFEDFLQRLERLNDEIKMEVGYV